ncbi:hypothetical protein SAY86_022088 [Trapa natans]|uniref:Uncharacterized protein n=1 Tax=Trapa natans TaxID=22666 RepID=A0AAN7RKS8_TRANT|nr:hypothetical protein SAY86_022088 [Trapa natans]
MGTEILRPQDCLAGVSGTSPALFPRRKGCNHGNPYSNNRINLSPSSGPRSSKKQLGSEKPDHKLRSGHPEPSVSRKCSSDDGRAERIGVEVTEKITVLRRGGSLDSKIKSEVQRKKKGSSTATKQLQGPYVRAPMMARCNLYAGSAFAVSPEPSALPLPSFSKKAVPFDDLATRDLRRILRLD